LKKGFVTPAKAGVQKVKYIGYIDILDSGFCRNDEARCFGAFFNSLLTCPRRSLVMQEKKIRVLILGYGEMGHAMEFLLAPQQTLHIWQRRPPAGVAPVNLAAVVPESDVILFCLPATAHAAVAAQIAPFVRDPTLCLTIAKGLDEGARLPATVLTETVGAARVAVLYGPMIAEEIRAGKLAFAECGASQPATYERIATLFRGTALRLEHSPDITGLSWSAILKNVYAMAFGMADELNLGDNTRGFLAVTALHELSAIVQQQGGAPVTPYWLAGLGDLITTATSASSHHHELGRLIVRNQRAALQGEGVHSLAMLEQFRPFESSSFPLLRLIATCVREPGNAPQAVRDFIEM
jgi:glycerol-3-phosphate dehydrogenase (NAD(P)+)